MRTPFAAVVDEKIFVFVTEHEIRTAARLRYPLSLLTVLPQVDGGSDPGAPDELADQLAGALSSVLRATDLIGRSEDASALQLLLVDAPLEALPGVIQRIAARVDAHRFRIGDDDKSVTLCVGGACFPATARTAEELASRSDMLAALAWRDYPSGSRYRLR